MVVDVASGNLVVVLLSVVDDWVEEVLVLPAPVLQERRIETTEISESPICTGTTVDRCLG